MATVYISDLDGTLLDPDAQLSTASRLGLEELLAEGVLFTVASARSLYSIRSILGDLPLVLPVISFNGGYVSHYESGEHLVVHGIEPTVAKTIQECLEANTMHPFISTNAGRDDHLYVGRELNAAMRWFYDERLREGDTRLRQVDDVRIAYREVVTCISIMGDAVALASLLEELESLCGEAVQLHLFENLYAEGAYWLTVHPAEATKANGVRTMLKSAQLLDAKTVVFGDHHNDAEMFQSATESIAMENAVPELKALATRCIGPNSRDSVLLELRRQVFD